ncbi:hypothetical protein C8R14_14415 [Nitrosomonas eutropha]|uniref:Uncharacterized protein n=1 Tax=Nitrosomonas eutropha TaxID=916 RepID=A0ABX5M7B4_9PROT|nr:hypothetical protein C8R14_14415 [Nitrosomonas eutropha]SEI42931.1 hypothetical protein SAMN05216318_102129 [Nitrosomonas eutropha]
MKETQLVPLSPQVPGLLQRVALRVILLDLESVWHWQRPVGRHPLDVLFPKGRLAQSVTARLMMVASSGDTTGGLDAGPHLDDLIRVNGHCRITKTFA